MKDFFKKIITAFKNFLLWLWQECKDWRTIVLLTIVCIVLGSPVWVGVLLGFVFGFEWAFVMAAVVWAFWMLPGAPFFALSVSITLAIKKIFKKRFDKTKKQTPSDEKTE